MNRFSPATPLPSRSASTIRAGLIERKDFAGQDIILKKPARNKLRNEGWLNDELTEDARTLG
jgi:hypothetical protein